MSNNPILIPVLGLLALQKSAQLVLCCLIALPLGFPKTGTDLAEAQWFRGSVLAAFFAEQQGVTHLGLRPRGELTPLNIVCVGEFGHTLKAGRHIALPTVPLVQGTVGVHLRPQT